MRYGIKLIFFASCFLVMTLGYGANIATIQPHRGSIQKSFTEPAETYLENTYTLTMPLDGQLERIKVREGSNVAEGQVVAKLVQEPLQEVVNKAEAFLHTVKLQYDLQKKTVARYSNLERKGFVEVSLLDEAQAKENVLFAQIAEAQAGLAIAKYNLSISKLSSPIDGVVLNRYTQGGAWLQTGQLLLRIGNLQQLEVICDVLTQEAQQLQLGDPVFLTSIGTPIVLHGQVKQIYPAGFTKKSSLGVDEQRVNVIVTLDNLKQARLGLGYRLQAKFLVGTRERDALVIPRFSVLQDPQGNYYVFVVKKDRIYKQVIKIGIMTDTDVAVTSGLATTDAIVEQPTASMQDGMKI